MVVGEYHFLSGHTAVTRPFKDLKAFIAWYSDPLRLLSMRKLGIKFVTYTEVDPGGLA